MRNLWRDEEAGQDELGQLVYLSRLIGQDPSLVQPGGGNTSLKLEERDPFGQPVQALVVKGSGTDLRTIGPQGFTHLYLDRLAHLRRRAAMTDEEMMGLMRACMLYPDRDPLPSVETPLHSLLPFRFIAHTHDVATLSLTDTPQAREVIERLYGRELAFLEYVRPGFPLARRLAERYGQGPPQGAIGLVLEKHGLVVWGETARECYLNLCSAIDRAEAFLAEGRVGKRVFGPEVRPPLGEGRRRALAAALMPVIRGELSRQQRVVLHFDDSPEVLAAIGAQRFPLVAAVGVATPEHILRSGRRPLVLEVDPAQEEGALKGRAREAIRRFRSQYEEYVRAQGGSRPIADYLKVVLIPGVGMICAGKDRCSALVAAACYRATLEVMAGAEAVDRFQFLSDADAYEVEYWPLERRKMEEGAKARRECEGKVIVVIGAASGIGRETALRLAEEGGHLVLADRDLEGVRALEGEINARFPERAHALAADVTDEEALAGLFREAVLRFGGVDVLFYSPGVAPRLYGVVEMPRQELHRQVSVHFLGAVLATRWAAGIMVDQGLGGRLIYNASKAAFAPGEGAAAYGASKAALVHYVRNVANELGRQGITANYINADAVDTPLFRSMVEERARRAGRSREEVLRRYQERSVLGTATVPPAYVAEAVLFLASDRSAYTTGCVITVGGGHEGFPR